MKIKFETKNSLTLEGEVIIIENNSLLVLCQDRLVRVVNHKEKEIISNYCRKA